MMADTCQTCTYSGALPIVGALVCRRYPPVPLAGPHGSLVSAYPPVKADLPACGEYRAKDTA